MASRAVQEVANSIHAEQIYHIICIDYISSGLTHLSITLDEAKDVRIPASEAAGQVPSGYMASKWYGNG